MMSNQITYEEAQTLAKRLLEVYNVEEILAIGGADEEEIITFLMYWDQLSVPEETTVPI